MVADSARLQRHPGGRRQPFDSALGSWLESGQARRRELMISGHIMRKERFEMNGDDEISLARASVASVSVNVEEVTARGLVGTSRRGQAEKGKEIWTIIHGEQ